MKMQLPNVRKTVPFSKFWFRRQLKIVKLEFKKFSHALRCFRGSMFVLSKRQFSLLTRSLSARWLGSGDTAALLDLGAGDGRPTLAMSAGFGRVLATEASAPMQRLLIDKGFQVVGIDEWAVPAEYDLIRKDSLRSASFFYARKEEFS